jgi:toxin YoeB
MSYDIEFSKKAERDYLHWEKHNPAYVRKIDQLLKEMKEDPRSGTGNPHPLRGNLQGYWGRSFSEEHRILYEIESERVLVHRFCGHYE